MIFSYLLHLMSALGGRRQNIAVRFGLDELECCSYRWRKKYENMFVLIQYTKLTVEWMDTG